MADVYSAIILDTDYWDGTESWAGETTEGNRDTKYSTRRFTSLSAWESARDGVSQVGDDEYAVISGPWASVDSTSFIISTFDADNLIIECPLTLPDGDNPARHDGIFGNKANAYNLESSNAGQVIGLGSNPIKIDGIQIHNTVTSDANNSCIAAPLAVTGIEIKNVICSAADTGGNGITIGNASNTGIISNCVIFCPHAQGISSEGIFIDNSSSFEIYNTVVYNFGQGIERDTGTVTVKNCAVFNNADDFDGTMTIDYCASGDGDGTNDVSPSGADWDNEFTNIAGFDFSVLDTDANIYLGSEITQDDDGNVPAIDIIGTARETDAGEQVCIGAFEYQAVGGYAIEADAGAYVKTGQNVGVLANRKIDMDIGAYVKTGQDVGLFGNRLLDSDPGAYALSGDIVSLLKDSILNIEEGSYDITGQDVGLLFDRMITNETGAYSITGQDIVIVKGHVISIDPGTYSSNGLDIGILKDSKILIDPDSYSISGQDVIITKGRRIAIESGTYLINGQDVNLIKAYILGADGSVYNLTGSDVTLTYSPIGGYTLVAESGAYNITGQDLNLLRTFLLSANVGNYTLTGQDASVLRGYPLTADAGAYNVAGQDIDFLRDLILSMEAGGYTITGQDAALIYSTGVRIASVTFDFKKRTIDFTLTKRSIDFSLSQRSTTMELE